jgi:hypothetical protein
VVARAQRSPGLASTPHVLAPGGAVGKKACITERQVGAACRCPHATLLRLHRSSSR